MNSKNQFRTVMIVLGLLTVGGLYYLYTQVKTAGDRWPYFNKPGTLTNKISSLEREVADLNAEVKKIPAAKERLEALKVEYELAATVLPLESTPDQLLAAIRLKAQQVNITPDSIVPTVVTPRAVKGAAAFEEWRFTLALKGTYDQLASFINKMEEFESTDPAKTASGKRFFQVQSIDITAEDSGLANLGGIGAEQNSKGHQCNLVMQTYRYTGNL